MVKKYLVLQLVDNKWRAETMHRPHLESLLAEQAKEAIGGESPPRFLDGIPDESQMEELFSSRGMVYIIIEDPSFILPKPVKVAMRYDLP